MPRRAYLTPDAAPESFECRALLLPTGEYWQAIIAGALFQLTDPGIYEQIEGITPEETAAVFAEIWFAYDSRDDCSPP